MSNENSNPFVCVAESSPATRAEFIRKTYTHLAFAILAFIGFEYFLFASGIAYTIAQFVFSFQYGFMALLGGFMLVAWLSQSMASGSASKGKQYAGMGLYVVAEGIIFAPILLLAATQAPGVISSAATMTLLLFGGLTATAFITRKDFSFLKSILTMGGFAALGLIACSFIFGIELGTWFSLAMIVFASAAILYTTSRIMYTYREDQYVGASVELFASVAMLFWYILRLLMSRD
ncbi:Bax inhibitor-1 family protein [Puniceicoccaceae bacterium K14]|nr:Bax inhibitor-1 family protein [Puniceicoccaceae bacterium K14]